MARRKRATSVPALISKVYGRPKYTQPTTLKVCFHSALRELLQQDPDLLIGVWEVIAEKALGGDLKACEMMIERLNGKSVTPLTIAGLDQLSDEHLAALRESLASAKN